MRTRPTAQERPEPFHRMHMHFTQAVAIVIACELTPSMVDMLMTVAPGWQTGIHAVRISLHQCAWINGVFDQRLDGLLLHVREQMDHDLTATLNHPKDWWSFLLHRASAGCRCPPTSTAFAPLPLPDLGRSLIARHHRGFVPLALVGERH